MKLLYKLIVVGFILVLLMGTSAALELGMNKTISKNDLEISADATYSLTAFSYINESSLTVSAVGAEKYATSGLKGPYDVLLVGDDSGVPDLTIIYAYNNSWTPSGTGDGPERIVLNSSVELEGNTRYWVVYNGSAATSANHINFAYVMDGAYDFNYTKWQAKVWDGGEWITPVKSSIDMYGIIWMYNGSEVVGDGQFALREDTRYPYSNRFEGQNISSGIPSGAFTIDDVSTRLKKIGTYDTLYFVVEDINHNELGNITIPDANISSDWVKWKYIFPTPIEIGAGNDSGLYCFFKSPGSTSTSNGYQSRAIEFLDAEHSDPSGMRYSTSGATEYDLPNMDAMLNMTITLAETFDDYYVSTGGSNSNNGSSPAFAFETISYALSIMENNNTLWIVDGEYLEEVDIDGENLNNISINRYSGTAKITNAGGICVDVSNQNNITLDGLYLNGSQYGIYAKDTNNLTLNNITIQTMTEDGIYLNTGCNNIQITDIYISDIIEHGIHYWNQYEDVWVSGLYIEGGTIKNSGHNMLDLHTNVSDIVVSGVAFSYSLDYSGDMDYGIMIQNQNVYDVNISNCTFTHIPTAIQINNADNVSVSSCTITNSTTWGVLLDKATFGTESNTRHYGLKDSQFADMSFIDCYRAYVINDNLEVQTNVLENVSWINNEFTNNDLDPFIVYDVKVFNSYIQDYLPIPTVANGNLTIDLSGSQQLFSNFTYRDTNNNEIYGNMGTTYTEETGYTQLEIGDDVDPIEIYVQSSTPISPSLIEVVVDSIDAAFVLVGTLLLTLIGVSILILLSQAQLVISGRFEELNIELALMAILGLTMGATVAVIGLIILNGLTISVV